MGKIKGWLTGSMGKYHNHWINEKSRDVLNVDWTPDGWRVYLHTDKQDPVKKSYVRVFREKGVYSSKSEARKVALDYMRRNP